MLVLLPTREEGVLTLIADVLPGAEVVPVDLLLGPGAEGHVAIYVSQMFLKTYPQSGRAPVLLITLDRSGSQLDTTHYPQLQCDGLKVLLYLSLAYHFVSQSVYNVWHSSVSLYQPRAVAPVQNQPLTPPTLLLQINFCDNHRRQIWSAGLSANPL